MRFLSSHSSYKEIEQFLDQGTMSLFDPDRQIGFFRAIVAAVRNALPPETFSFGFDANAEWKADPRTQKGAELVARALHVVAADAPGDDWILALQNGISRHKPFVDVVREKFFDIEGVALQKSGRVYLNERDAAMKTMVAAASENLDQKVIDKAQADLSEATTAERKNRAKRGAVYGKVEAVLSPKV